MQCLKVTSVCNLCVVYYNLDEDDDTAGHSGDQGAHRHEPEVSRGAEHAEGGQAAGNDQHPVTLAVTVTQ